jgi:hypothetical protein
VIRLADPRLYFLAEPKERYPQQNHSDEEEPCSAEGMIQPEEGTGETYNKQGCRTQATRKREADGPNQQGGPVPQAWQVRLEVGARPIIGIDIIQIANAIDYQCQSSDKIETKPATEQRTNAGAIAWEIT